MKTSTIVMVAVLLAGMSAGISAHVTSLGKLSAGDSGNIGFKVSNHSFTDYVKFKLTDSLSDISGKFQECSISNFIVSLEHEVVKNSWNTVHPSFTSDFSFANLQAGKYRLEIDGIGTAQSLSNPSHWSGTLRVAAAVPEADVALMLLIGGGMIALQLRRKQQFMGRRPLTTA